jgi:hypothetical protein
MGEPGELGVVVVEPAECGRRRIPSPAGHRPGVHSRSPAGACRCTRPPSRRRPSSARPGRAPPGPPAGAGSASRAPPRCRRRGSHGRSWWCHRGGPRTTGDHPPRRRPGGCRSPRPARRCGGSGWPVHRAPPSRPPDPPPSPGCPPRPSPGCPPAGRSAPEPFRSGISARRATSTNRSISSASSPDPWRACPLTGSRSCVDAVHTHSSSRGRPGRTRPRPKKRPN